jgi:hypothetical protein
MIDHDGTDFVIHTYGLAEAIADGIWFRCGQTAGCR